MEPTPALTLSRERIEQGSDSERSGQNWRTVERVNVGHVFERPDLHAAVLAGAVERLGAVAERQAVDRPAVARERLQVVRGAGSEVTH